MKRRKKQRKSKAVPQITTDNSALLRHNTRALANQIACYIIQYVYYNPDSKTDVNISLPFCSRCLFWAAFALHLWSILSCFVLNCGQNGTLSSHTIKFLTLTRSHC
jgi:hypothetical protein